MKKTISTEFGSMFKENDGVKLQTIEMEFFKTQNIKGLDYLCICVEHHRRNEDPQRMVSVIKIAEYKELDKIIKFLKRARKHLSPQE